MLKKMDKTLLITSIILFIIGIIMIFSASNVTSFMKNNNAPYYYVIRQMIFLSISCLLSFFVIKFNTKSYNFWSWVLLIIVTFLLIVVLLYGKLTNQARSWISLFGGINIQPSEFIKVISIVWFASFYSTNKDSKYKTYLLMLAIILSITLLIVLQPDLGTASIYLAIIFLMFLSLPISKKVKRNIFLSFLGVSAIVLILLMNNGVQVLFKRQINRINYFNPCSEEKFYDTGTQVCNSFIAFNNGGLFGKGLGNSTQKYLYLPEAYTDFIFAIVVEELGFVGGFVILILMFIILWRIFIIAKSAKNTTNRLICYGVFWYILLHIFINLGGITGTIPLTGVPLPFLSYGGSYSMCLLMALTLVQRVYIETNEK